IKNRVSKSPVERAAHRRLDGLKQKESCTHMKKALIALLACLIVLTGCTKSPAPAPSETETVPVTTEAPTEPHTETTATEPVETQAPVTGPVNPLTGLPGDASLAESRPYAVMINNIRV